MFFLALKEEIRAELESGWRMIAVYERHAAALDISYSQFTRYVREFISKQGMRKLAKRAVPTPQAAAAPAGSGTGRTAPAKGEDQALPVFQFDPLDAYITKFV